MPFPANEGICQAQICRWDSQRGHARSGSEHQIWRKDIADSTGSSNQ